MSIKVMSMVFDRYPSGGMERLLALAMADHASDDGRRIWPSVDELARKTMQSRSSVQRQIRRMVAIGWLIQVKSATGRPGVTNEYRICPEWIEGGEVPTPETGVNLTPLDESPPAEVIHTGVNLTPVSNPERGVTTAERGVTGDERGVTAMTPESSEPSMNHTPLPPGGGATGFDELFSIYPNQDNRSKAERRYRRLAPTAGQQQTMRVAIEAQRLSKRWTKDDGEFVPEFATWLRNERWRDVPRAPGAAAGAWHETRSGIDAMARALGLAAWDEGAFSMGRGESYLAFTARVRHAVDVAGSAVCA
ncbi:helix-turn-helix domain-containing protein [Variovorax sp. RB3P1]|uniref:helix-turn-helix domain-containing protein n=1 Tax=Variovorax sp. RB3P1 TaxID=3443732 RepID=UPI003F44899B